MRVLDAGQLRFVTCWDPGGSVLPAGSSDLPPAAVGGQEDGAICALADGQVDRPRRPRASGIVTTLPPFVAIKGGPRWWSSAPSDFQVSARS